MGFSIQNIVILYWLKHYNFLKAGDSVLELGSQQINNDIIENLESCDGLAKLFGVAPFTKTFHWKVRDPIYLDSGMQHLPEDAPYARKLYEHLGLKYACVDIDDHPDSINLDLNYDPVPQVHKGKYALVTNLGTTEHALNQLNAFKVIHDFTAPHGIMLHTLPFQGFATHGLVNYTPKFFWLLARSNRYQVIEADISGCKRIPISDEIVNYTKDNSSVFKDKSHVAKLELQDMGITAILQKCQDVDFVPPLDAPVGAKASDPRLLQRYKTAFERRPGEALFRRGKIFLKKFFNR